MFCKLFTIYKSYNLLLTKLKLFGITETVALLGIYVNYCNLTNKNFYFIIVTEKVLTNSKFLG